ncbi:MAG: M48 family metalloprotease, partial [Bacteroidota bacterium]
MALRVISTLVICSFLLPKLTAQFEPAPLLPADTTAFFNDLRQRTDPANQSIPAACRETYAELHEEYLDELLTDLRDSVFVFQPELRAYFTELFRRIAAANNLDLDPLVLIRRSQQANAYSMGNGIFTIHLGLLQNLPTEERLAFVLCHELAHDQLKHGHHIIIEHCQREKSLEEVRHQLTRRRNLRNRDRRRALTH